jgi:hypothetical protein
MEIPWNAVFGYIPLTKLIPLRKCNREMQQIVDQYQPLVLLRQIMSNPSGHLKWSYEETRARSDWSQCTTVQLVDILNLVGEKCTYFRKSDLMIHIIKYLMSNYLITGCSQLLLELLGVCFGNILNVCLIFDEFNPTEIIKICRLIRLLPLTTLFFRYLVTQPKTTFIHFINAIGFGSSEPVDDCFRDPYFINYHQIPHPLDTDEERYVVDLMWINKRYDLLQVCLHNWLFKDGHTIREFVFASQCSELIIDFIHQMDTKKLTIWCNDDEIKRFIHVYECPIWLLSDLHLAFPTRFYQGPITRHIPTYVPTKV